MACDQQITSGPSAVISGYVEFDDAKRTDDNFFALHERLENLLDRRADLVTDKVAHRDEGAADSADCAPSWAARLSGMIRNQRPLDRAASVSYLRGVQKNQGLLSLAEYGS
jgi:hypothetical protein